MKALFASLLLTVSTFGAQLGVLYNDTNSNLVSPLELKVGTLKGTNVNLLSGVASRALSTDASSNIVVSTLTAGQQTSLASIVVNTNLVTLGTVRISANSGSPTNGVAGVPNGTLYFKSGGTNAADLLFVSYNTNWFSVASTNGASINESQLNFSDNTTANATTNMHGLLMKLSGTNSTFLNGVGAWAEPLNPFGYMTDGYIPFYDGSAPPSLRNTAIKSLGQRRYQIEGNGVGQNGSIHTYAVYATNTVNITNVAASSLLRLDSGNNVTNAAIGAGLTFDGTTLSVTGVGTNTINSSGSPLANQVTYWTSPTQISGDTDFTFDGTTVTATTLTAANLSVTGSAGNIVSGTYTPTRTVVVGCTTVGTTALPLRYTRIANIVTVSGRVQMARTSSGAETFRLSLPVASNLANPYELGGNAQSYYQVSETYPLGGTFVSDVIITGDATNNEAIIQPVDTSGTGTVRNYYLTFSYSII